VIFFRKRLGIFSPNFTCPFYVPIYARLQTFILLSATFTKLCHIKRDHPVYIISSKMSAYGAELHAGWSHLIRHNYVIVDDWIKICNLVWIGTHIRRVKFELKISNRLWKMSEKLRGVDFLTHTVVCALTEKNTSNGCWKLHNFNYDRCTDVVNRFLYQVWSRR